MTHPIQPLRTTSIKQPARSRGACPQDWSPTQTPSALKQRPQKRGPDILGMMQHSSLDDLEETTHTLVKRMVKDGARFRFATPYTNSEGLLLEDDGPFGWRAFRRFRRHVRGMAEESEYIWITDTSACSLAAVRTLPNMKVLDHHHHHSGRPFAAARWFGFYHAFCRELDVITYPTDFSRKEALRIAPWLRNQTHVVPFGFEVPWTSEADYGRRKLAARRALNLSEETFIVGSAGSLVPGNRFDIFLRTAAQIKEQVPHAIFSIRAEGPSLDELTVLASKFGIADSLRFIGPDTDPTVCYQAWDLCLVNSDYDGLARTPMEAAANGCVVAASVLRGALSEFLSHGQNGIFQTAHDSEVMAKEVTSLARDPERAKTLRHAAAETIQTRYSTENRLGFYRCVFV